VPIITLSRGSKSGGLALAELLAVELNCNNLISREVLVKASEDYGVTEKELAAAMKKPPKFWERSSGNPRHLYLTFIRAALLDYASKGCLIYHGNAGHFLLGDVSWVLKVRLIAPLEQRIAMLQRSMKIDKAEAIQYITKVDEDRQRWTRFLYGEEWSDPAHFDVVINLRTMSLDTACKTIAFLAETPEFRRTEERTKDLEDKALAARVYAALEADPRTRGSDVDVRASGSIVSLSGRITHANMRKLIIEIASAVPGVSQVKDGITTY